MKRRTPLVLLICLIGLLSATIASTQVRSAPPVADAIILMIGDGMGANQLKAASLAASGLENQLQIHSLAVGDVWVETTNADGDVTDSAAAATAMATGRKTSNGVLSQGPDGAAWTTILEMAQALGKAVGLVTTVPVTHATPAAFAAHTGSRNETMQIAEMLLDAELDVLFGGGAQAFLPYRTSVECGWSGWRIDGLNLVQQALDRGDHLVCDQEQLGTFTGESGDRVLGLFANEEMLFPVTPTLAEMTRKAIELLAEDPDGFFLVIEAGQIDWAAHSNDAERVIDFTLGFDEAVGVALEYIRSMSDTLLIVTADHETGGMGLTHEPTGASREDGPITMPDGKPFFVNWAGTSHTGAAVPLFAEGLGVEAFSGTIDNTQIYHIMVKSFGWLPNPD